MVVGRRNTDPATPSTTRLARRDGHHRNPTGEVPPANIWYGFSLVLVLPLDHKTIGHIPFPIQERESVKNLGKIWGKEWFFFKQGPW